MKNFINIADIEKKDLRKIIDHANHKRKKDLILANQL